MVAVQHIIETPLGWMLIEGDEEFIQRAHWLDEDDITIGQGTHPAPWKAEVEQQTREYFDAKRKEFALPLKPMGTAFQSLIWDQLKEIPSGTTLSYADLGSVDQARAIGTAVGANPILLFIPCHRVIGSDGKLHGYAAGVERKEALLKLEGANQPQQLRLF